MAHEQQTKILLSVGGWTGSKRFSPMVATAERRKQFIDWNLQFIEKYNTDGVDLDWEYPGKQAAGCNEFADNDADNFLLLLKELRQALDAKFPEVHKEISMAVHVQPFIKSGAPMTDLQAFVPYFDHVNLMTYGTVFLIVIKNTSTDYQFFLKISMVLGLPLLDPMHLSKHRKEWELHSRLLKVSI